MNKQLCALCGVNEATTKDHLPPKGIYPKPINIANMHKVPACLSCNGGGSKEDEEFKVFMGLETGEFRENKDKLISSMAGTVKHNNRLASQIFSSAKNTYAKYRGPIAEKVVSIEFSSDAYYAVISRIVRGLYWRENEVPLGLTAKIDVFQSYNLSSDMAQSFKELMDMLPPNKLNNDTFHYKTVTYEDGASMWGIQFFGRHTVFAITEAPRHNKTHEL